MNNLYDHKFLSDVLYFLTEELDNLAKWSVYNQDTCLDEIHEFSEQFKALRKKLTEIDKSLLNQERSNYAAK